MSSKFRWAGLGDIKVLDTLFEESEQEQEDGSDIDSEEDYGTHLIERRQLEVSEDYNAREITEGYLEVCEYERSRSSSRPSFFPSRFWERYVIEGRKFVAPHGEEGEEEEESFLVRRRGEGGLCVVRVLCGCEEQDRGGQTIRGYGEKVDKELAILESIIDGQELPMLDEADVEESEPQFPSDQQDHREVAFTSFREARDGSVFVQKIFDIFMTDMDDKVYIIQSYYERSLEDERLRAWFKLPYNEGYTAQNITQLDPDGTFTVSKNTWARPYYDTLQSLKVLACEVTLGLLFLHKRGIVHYNLEPKNIMVTSSGHIEISKFEGANLLPKLQSVTPGISDLVSVDLGSNDTLSAQEMTFGSLKLADGHSITFNPKHVAPELLNPDVDGSIVYDERLDWWCLGVLLGELAYDTDIVLTSHSISEEEDHFRDFVHGLLACDPDQRLSGLAVKKHTFLDLSEENWLEILGLRYRPCPTSAEITESPQTSGDSTPTQYADSASSMEEEDLDDHTQVTQPFPSTVSLWVNDLQNQSGIDVEETSKIKILASDGFNDSGVVLQEPPLLLVEGAPWQETDTYTSKIPPIPTESGVEDLSYLSVQPDNKLEIVATPDTVRLGQSGADVIQKISSVQDDVKTQVLPHRKLTMDEMVALSLLQAREEDGMDVEGRVRVGKARFIVNATKQAIKVVKQHIYETVRCR